MQRPPGDAFGTLGAFSTGLPADQQPGSALSTGDYQSSWRSASIELRPGAPGATAGSSSFGTAGLGAGHAGSFDDATDPFATDFRRGGASSAGPADPFETWQSRTRQTSYERVDPKRLTMGLDLDNDGGIDQLMQGPLGVDVDNDGVIDVIITPDQLRAFIAEQGVPLSGSASNLRKLLQPGAGTSQPSRSSDPVPSRTIGAQTTAFPQPALAASSRPATVLGGRRVVPGTGLAVAPPAGGAPGSPGAYQPGTVVPPQPYTVTVVGPPVAVASQLPQASVSVGQQQAHVVYRSTPVTLDFVPTPPHSHADLRPPMGIAPPAPIAAQWPPFAMPAASPYPFIVMPPQAPTPPRQGIFGPPQILPVFPQQPVLPAPPQPALIHHPPTPPMSAAFLPEFSVSWPAPPKTKVPVKVEKAPEPQTPSEPEEEVIEEVIEKTVIYRQFVDKPFLQDRIVGNPRTVNVSQGQGFIDPLTLRSLPEPPVRIRMKRVGMSAHDTPFPYHDPVADTGCDFVGHHHAPTTENPWLAIYA